MDLCRLQSTRCTKFYISENFCIDTTDFDSGRVAESKNKPLEAATISLHNLRSNNRKIKHEREYNKFKEKPVGIVAFDKGGNEIYYDQRFKFFYLSNNFTKVVKQ